jgi:hypothetical protein
MGVDARIFVGRRHRDSGAQFGHVLRQVFEELRHVVEEQRPGEVLRGAHLADLRLPFRQDVVPPLPQEVGQATEHLSRQTSLRHTGI